MTKTKTKTKTKSLTKTAGSFPTNAWQYDMEYCIDLPRFFASQEWQKLALTLPPPPDANKTREELAELMRKQKVMRDWAYSFERDQRLRDIEKEAGAHDPEKIMRLLMIQPGGGGYPATYMLMEGMIVLGKIVVVHFKSQFMRPRPSQLEPRLRPLLDVPGHPAYPSGHSLQMFLVAKALSTVVRSHEIGQELFRIAEEIAVNREWAGLHYESDTQASKKLAFEMFPLVLDAYAGSFQKAAEEWL